MPAVLAAVAFLGCPPPGGRVRPPPPPSVGRPISDPPPSRVVVHATIFREGLTKALASALPRQGDGDVDLVAGKKLHYSWQREPVTLRFDRGRIVVGVTVNARTNLLGERLIPITVTIYGEPVVTADFKAALQSTDVLVRASSSLDTVNKAVEEKLHDLIAKALEDFRMDVRPLVMNAFARIAKPIEIQLADQIACVELKIVALEAGPTVLADGVEKDLGLVVLPSVTLPCTPVASLLASASAPDGGTPDAGTAGAGGGDGGTPPGDGGTPLPNLKLPLLQNVASLPTGPFTVVVPVAARYEELSAAIEKALPNGKLFFSENHPDLYLHHPRVYASEEQIVIRVLLGGKANVAGSKLDMDGEIYFSGHPKVIDNQITVPDLDITPGTAGELVKLKIAVDHDSLVDQARTAMRVDVSERLAAVKDKLSTELTFAEDMGCMRATVFRSEVTGIFPHQHFLRIYVTVDAQAGLYMPCKR
ncbi:MAG TPA: DUF4403 family protein [Myxococcales bacterium]|nr:DUF4403 family protein [Myxococcales bacterium]